MKLKKNENGPQIQVTCLKWARIFNYAYPQEVKNSASSIKVLKPGSELTFPRASGSAELLELAISYI